MQGAVLSHIRRFAPGVGLSPDKTTSSTAQPYRKFLSRGPPYANIRPRRAPGTNVPTPIQREDDRNYDSLPRAIQFTMPSSISPPPLSQPGYYSLLGHLTIFFFAPMGHVPGKVMTCVGGVWDFEL